MRLIDADALWNYIGQRVGNGEVSMDVVYEAIQGTPIIDAAPVVHATWHNLGEGMCRCSECNRMKAWRSDYCPNCGANMDLEPTAP